MNKWKRRLTKKEKKRIIVIGAVVLLLAVMALSYFAGSDKYVRFTKWAQTLTVEKIQKVRVGDSVLNDNEVPDFLKQIQAITEEKCYRKENYAYPYEGYQICLDYEGDEIVFQCLLDKTVLFVWNDEELILDSIAFWNYICDIRNKKGSTTIESDTKLMENLFETTADLNHDGNADLIRVIQINKIDAAKYDKGDDGVYLRIFLGNENGTFQIEPAYQSERISQDRGGNATWVLTENDGKDYLLCARMADEVEWARYVYSIMDIGVDGTIRTVTNNDYQFVIEPGSDSWENSLHREDCIPYLKEELEPWIVNGIILASFDWDTPTFISSDSNVLPASEYFDLVWERSEAD